MDNWQKNSEKSPATWPYKKRVIVLIMTLSIFRLIISSILDLGNDESYYWLYSQDLKWSYFDHPPMVAIWIRIFTANLWLQQYELFLRLGSVAGCAMSTWFMYKCVSTLSTERSGWFAAILYNASFYAGITAGLFIMPDSPQMVFWTLSLWIIARINADESRWLNWILLGIASGLCIMSKVHGVFIWLGVAMFAIFIKRSWLANPRLFVSAGLTILVASPILIWNIQNNFAMYQFHVQRIIPKAVSLNQNNFLREFFGQIIINNVFNVFLIFIALLALFKGRIKHRETLTIYIFIGLPFLLILLLISLYKHTFPHWSGPAYISLIPIAAIYLSEVNTTLIFPRILKYAIGLHIIFLILCVLEIEYYPGQFGNKTRENLGKGDITLDMNGWKEAGKKFAEIYREEVSSGKVPPGSPVVCFKWWGSHIEYYFCRPWNIQMIGLGDMNELHQYIWLNKERSARVNFNTAYCIVPSDEDYNVHDQYIHYYNNVDTAGVIEIFRNHVATHNFYIYRLTGWKNNLPLSK